MTDRILSRARQASTGASGWMTRHPQGALAAILIAAALPAADLAKLQGLLAGHFEPVRNFGTEYAPYAWR